MHAALDDAEQVAARWRWILAVIVRVRARGPAHGALHRIACLRLSGWPGRAVIEAHGDVGPQRALHIHRICGCEVHLTAIDGRSETHPLLADLAQFGEAEHLEAARVGEDGFLPVHEAMQPPMCLDDL